MTTWNISRASPVQQRIVGAQNSGFLRQHHGNALAHGIGQPIRPTYELEGMAGTEGPQRSFANRTYQQVEQTLIHNTPDLARRALQWPESRCRAAHWIRRRRNSRSPAHTNDVARLSADILRHLSRS